MQTPSSEALAAAISFGKAPAAAAKPLGAPHNHFFARRHSLALTYSATTCILVSTFIIINHLVFAYAQLAGIDMIEGGKKASTDPRYWDEEAGLFKVVFNAHVDFNATSADARELQSFAYKELCKHSAFYPEIDCIDAVDGDTSVCVILKCQKWQMHKQALQMSYMYSIWELWEMQTVEPLPGEPAESISTANVTKEYGKPGAVVLFGFSFVWPHVKLALLHLFFYLPMTSKGRRNGNYWLAVFGKWSFTDVLVCATLVGVFKLTIDSTADKIWQKAAPDLNAACVSACQDWVGTSAPGPKIDSAVEAAVPPLGQFGEWRRDQEAKLDAQRNAMVDRMFGGGLADSCSCDWLDEYACPGAPPGASGHAQPDGSVCFEQCCPGVDPGAKSGFFEQRLPGAYHSWQSFGDSMEVLGEELQKSPSDRATEMACSSGCSRLRKAINQSLTAAEHDVESNVQAAIQLEGMVAMYAFCLAVMLSLVLSIVVERLEGRGQPLRKTAGWASYDSGEEDSDSDQAGPALLSPPPSPPPLDEKGPVLLDVDGAPAGSASPPSDSEAWTEEPDRSEDPDRHPDSSGSVPYSPTGSAGLPEVQSSLRQRGARGLQSASRGISTVKASFRTSVRSLQTSMAKDVRTKRERKLRRQMTVLGGARPFLLSREWLWHVSLCAATSYLLYLSMFMSCFDRVVTGSVPALLKQNGFDFDEEYSIWSLADIIYELGGLNRHLMYTTYLIFCVIGPVTRCSTQLLLLLLPLPTKWLRALHELSRNASIFYALEVLLVAVPLLNMTFGPVSKNLLTVKSQPALCVPLAERFGEETCLMLSVNLAKGYYVLCVHVALFLYSGFDGSPTHKYCQHELHRSDCPPFPCCSRGGKKGGRQAEQASGGEAATLH